MRKSEIFIVKPKKIMPLKINCLNSKCSIAENSERLFISTEHLIFVSILRILLGKCEKLKLFIDEPPYCTFTKYKHNH